MELLIKNVRSHPYLWNKNHISYRDNTRKDNAWELVAGECGIANAYEAKFQWKRLRDSHREALRRRKTSSGQTGQNDSMPPWKYEKLMEFLLPQTKIRDKFSNSGDFLGEASNDENITDTHMKLRESHLVQPTCPESSNKNKAVEDVDDERTNIRDEGLLELQELQRILTSKNHVPRDALTDLFSSMCQKTRDLPKYLQLRVQREIFESVTRAEEEALHESSMGVYFSPSSSASSFGHNPMNPLRPSTSTVNESQTETANKKNIKNEEIDDLIM